MRKLFSFLLALLAFTAQAQVTFKITAVPANTPANTTIYLAGSFNNWNPGSAAHALTYDATDRSYQITLPAGQHAEWFWRREFPAGYAWLYAPTMASAARSDQRLAVSFYPNPTARELRVTLPATVAGEAQLEISDVAGRAVLRTRVRNGQTVDVSRLPAGLYLSRLSAGGAVGVSKFSKE